MEPNLACHYGSSRVALVQHCVTLTTRLELGESSLMADHANLTDSKLRVQKSLHFSRCRLRSNETFGDEAIRPVEIRQLVRNHFSQERPLERTGVANLVRIPLHHSVLPLVHPARWQALELRVVLWQMHQPMELRVHVGTPARIHTQVQEDLDALPQLVHRDATQRDGT